MTTKLHPAAIRTAERLYPDCDSTGTAQMIHDGIEEYRREQDPETYSLTWACGHQFKWHGKEKGALLCPLCPLEKEIERLSVFLPLPETPEGVEAEEALQQRQLVEAIVRERDELKAMLCELGRYAESYGQYHIDKWYEGDPEEICTGARKLIWLGRRAQKRSTKTTGSGS